MAMSNSYNFSNRFVQMKLSIQNAFRFVSVALLLALGFLAMSSVSASAQNTSRLRIANMGGAQHVQLGLNKSLLVDLPRDVSEVIVSQPTVAGAIMRNGRSAIIQGIEPGETNIFFLDANGGQIAVIEISVVNDVSNLMAALRSIVPNSQIKVDSFGDRIVLSGTAKSSDDIDKAMAIAAQFAGGENNVANVITVNGPQQVMLKVTVAEVQRETISQLGINLSGALSIGSMTTGLISNPPLGGASNVVSPNAFSLSGAGPGIAIDATLTALERRGALRTLASPTLTAISGGEATFLAGGEYPVPVGFEDNKVIFEFKEFGVNLKFSPVVHSDGMISLDVETSVSETTTEGGFNAGGGITIPAIRNREAKTSVQMRSGETLAIAGLIEDKVRQQFNTLPGIGNIPILGALFRSRDFVRSQTELLILVTPIMAHPGGAVRLPTDKMNFSGDAEAIFLGHMQRLYGVGEGNGDQLNGSVGFVLD